MMTNLKNELLPYQQEAVDKLIRLKVGALFMEQGTGKSITTMEMARIRLMKNKIDHIIWLCPCSAKQNIKFEILRHCPDEMLNKFTICGIETLSTSVRAISYLLELSATKRCFLVVDESLMVKNFFAKRTQNIVKIAAQCPYRLILNGTPISRNEADLFAQFYLLDWRILGYRSYYTFAHNHLEYNQYGKLVGCLKVGQLTDHISPYSYRITKDECLTLPPKQYDSCGFGLTEEQWKHYDEVADKLLMLVDEFDSSTIYRLFSGLRAVMSGKRVIFDEKSNFKTCEFFDDPLDNPRIRTLLTKITNEKTIVFCEYESEISQLCELFGDKAVRFDGTIPIKQRNKNLVEFKNNPDKLYLIANKSCAGYSLNLQFCSHIIYMSQNWDLGTRLQSEDRVHRLGQKEPVSITDIYAIDTLDSRIIKCLYKKENLLEQVRQGISNKQSLFDLIHDKGVKADVIESLSAEDCVRSSTRAA